MQVKRFVAKDMRRALELVRQQLGEDAVILSSRRVKDGVEILTSQAQTNVAVPSNMDAMETSNGLSDSLFPQGSEKAGKSSREIAADIELASRKLAAREQVEASADEFLRNNQVVNAGIKVPGEAANSPSSQRPQPTRGAVGQSAAERYGLLADEPQSPVAHPRQTGQQEIELLHEEIAQMRMLLEEQLSTMGAGSRPTSPGGGGAIAQKLQRMGLSEKLARAVLRKPLQNKMLTRAWPEAMARVSRAVPVAGDDLVARGGVFALVGPTGAGKTTTVAKLAVRYVMQHGPDKVALVTTDSQRLAGQDQLRALASILKVPLRVVDDNNSLSAVLRSLRNVELVLIDTAGRRHGDPELKRQMIELASIQRIRSLLVLPANSQLQMLKASVHAYREAGVRACILTKLDETASLGEAIECAIQAKLPIAYTTDGQDIPEDIHLARGPGLLSKAANLAASAATAERQRHKQARPQ